MVRPLKATLIALLAGIAVVFPGDALADEGGKCLVTAYEFTSHNAAENAARELRDGNADKLPAGVPLPHVGNKTLELKRGGAVLVVVDSPAPLAKVTANLAGYGGAWRTEHYSEHVAGRQAVIGPWKVGSPGHAQLAVDAGSCATKTTVTTTGSAFLRLPTITAGLLGLITIAAGVVMARSPVTSTAGKVRRTVAAASLGLVAGIAEAVVLYETGAIGPASKLGFVLPILFAVVIAAVSLVPRRRDRVQTPAREPVAAPPGAVIGRYQLTQVLGSGSTGTTYLATDPSTQQEVALKVLSTQLVNDPTFVQRFLAEAQVMAQLTDPHCVRLKEFLSAPGAVSIVTEYVPGISLRVLLRKQRRLTGEQALGVLTGALRGLAHLHSHQLVHRDVKPDNIIVDQKGTSRLIDYGLARSAGITGDEVEGSPSYMSPEQIRNRPLTNRTDIYSAGAVLAELITGRKIFAGANVQNTIANHLNMPVPDLARTDGIHPALAAVVSKALAKDPEARYHSVTDFLAELERAAVTVYGPDWQSRAALGAMISAIASVGTVIAGTTLGSVAGAGVVGTTSAGVSVTAGTSLTNLGASALVAAVVASSGVAAVAATAPPTPQPADHFAQEWIEVRYTLAELRRGLPSASSLEVYGEPESCRDCQPNQASIEAYAAGGEDTWDIGEGLWVGVEIAPDSSAAGDRVDKLRGEDAQYTGDFFIPADPREADNTFTAGYHGSGSLQADAAGPWRGYRMVQVSHIVAPEGDESPSPVTFANVVLAHGNGVIRVSVTSPGDQRDAAEAKLDEVVNRIVQIVTKYP